MADILYLANANPVREYHHQDLPIFAAPEGRHFEIGYGERWLEPGEGCAVVNPPSPQPPMSATAIGERIGCPRSGKVKEPYVVATPY